MALIRDKVCPDDFGDCGGMGRCATCQVSIKGGLNSPVHMQRNEAETLRKAGVSHALARLSCQILITEDLENLFVVVL
jgi:2Fe-2S ferredoxin